MTKVLVVCIGLVLVGLFTAWMAAVPLMQRSLILFLVAVGWIGVKKQKKAEQTRLETLDFHTLSPLEYEQFCAVKLRDAGWDVKMTPLQDQGVDVIADLRGTRAVIQCKKYTRPVGNKAVQEIVAGRRHYAAQVAVVVCPVTYTRSAHQLARSNGVMLMHHDQLSNLEALAKIP